MEFNINKIKEDLKANLTNYHDAIVDLCYDEWSKNKDWSYGDMVCYAGITYGSFAKLLVYLSVYDSQVCNGGHQQYFDNGYASDGGGCFAEHDTKHLRFHNCMINLCNQFGFNNTEMGKAFLEIQIKFKSLLRTNEFEDGLDELDSQYYDFKDDWNRYINTVVIGWLENGTNPLEA